jgi:hypothetical protein
VVGRFIQPDTIVPNEFDPQAYDRYAYARDNPLRYVDPTGHAPGDDVTAASARALLADEDEDAKRKIQWGGAAMQSASGVLRSAFELNPIVGTYDAGYQAATGKDAIDPSQSISSTERLISTITAVSAVLPAGEEAWEALGGVKAVAGTGSLEQRAKELHGLLNPQAQRMRTTAVTTTKEGVTVVSSSENALSKAQKAALKPGEVAAEGAGHAEITGINHAKQAGLTPTATAASRPICPECAKTLQEQGVTPASPVKPANQGGQ